MNEEILTFIRAGDFLKAMELINENPSAINYIEPESDKSILMIAISNMTKNAMNFTNFVSFMLKHPNFSSINHYSQKIKQTAFDMLLDEPVEPIVVLWFIKYHLAHNMQDCCIFTNKAILKGLDNLSNEALKYEVAYKYYNRAKQKLESGKSTQSNVDRICEIKDLLKNVAQQYAANNPALLSRINAVEPMTNLLAAQSMFGQPSSAREKYALLLEAQKTAEEKLARKAMDDASNFFTNLTNG